MKKLAAIFLLPLALFGQQPQNVQKVPVSNLITAPLVVGSGQSITPTGSGVIQATTGTASSMPWSGLTSIPSPTVTWTGDVSGTATLSASGGVSNALTLATVNSNVGTFASVTVNGKGLATAAANLSGDLTTSGSVATLDTVNANVGTFAVETVNAKGLATAAQNISGDATTSGAVLTLATVNSNVGSFGSATQAPQVTVNAKGLVTAAANVTVTPAYINVTGVPATSLIGNATGSTANASAVSLAGSLAFNAGNLQLSGDSTAPGNDFFYGTNNSGVKGFYALASFGVTSIAGTANQISASASIGAVTLSLAGPHNYATQTAHGVLLGEGSSPIAASAAGTSGQAFISGGSLADGAYGALSLAGGSSVVTGTLPVGNGGTGVATMTGIPYGAGTANFSAVGFSGSSIVFTAPNLALSGDSSSPGNNYVYGTNGSGTKGWVQLSSEGVTSITGTAGQVLANGLTTPQMGAVTLTFPAAVYGPTSVGIGTGTNAAATVLQVVDTSTSTQHGVTDDQYNTGTNSAQFNARKARGTFASPTTIVTGDVLGRYLAWGYDGTQFIESGNLRFVSSGTIATNEVPSQAEIWTSTNASPSVLTRAVYWDSSQTEHVLGTAAASSTVTGAIQDAGGLGVVGAGYFGGLLNVGGSVLAANGESLTLAGGSSLTDNGSGQIAVAAATSGAKLTLNAGTGSAVLSGNSSITGAILVLNTDDAFIDINDTNGMHYNWRFGSQIVTSQTYQIVPSTVAGGTTFSTPLLTLNGSTSAVTIGSSSSIVTVPGTTASTSTTTGALQDSGGLGVAGAGWFGGNLFATSHLLVNSSTLNFNSPAQVHIDTDLNVVIQKTGSVAAIISQNDANTARAGLSVDGSTIIFHTGTGATLAGTMDATQGLTMVGGLFSSSPTAGVGYAAGAGTSVTQTTSRTTGVIANTVTGKITLVSAIGTSTPATFTVTDSAIGADDTVSITEASGTDAYAAVCSGISAGTSWKFTVWDLTGTTTEAPVFNFTITKGAHN